MTSAPVKEVNPFMNLPGGKNSVKTGNTDNKSESFGDVMNKTKGGSSYNQFQAIANGNSVKTPAPQTANSRRDSLKPQETVKETAKPENLTKDQEQALEEAGEKVMDEIAEELGVSREDVEKAMEELGLSIYALFDPSNLTQLVLMLNGAEDATALLTDGNLFDSLQNLLGTMQELKAELSQEMGISPEDMQTVLEEMQNRMGGQGEDVSAKGEANEPQITVEVKYGEDTVKLSTDENGNATKVVDVASAKPETEVEAVHQQTDNHEQKEDESSKGQSQDAGTGNLLLNTLSQEKLQAAEVPFEQTTEIFSQQSRDIMDQIMDYMKIQLKPGMEQLEMQLHPESLGTVHIQLSSKGGEITAQFHVQNETVKAAIESQITTLQESLKEQGVKVEAVQVTVESHGFESNLWQGQGKEENADASSENNRRPLRRINLNEVDGILDEEASEEEVLAAKMMEMNGNTVDYTV
ncbi:flagellar hook-length control protein FliK [Parablautia muri]|uniref:Flagellar hook-length control protein FliK n=1 Tax=Parablautia muri TaxID=2320879 RepID=A0A9X5BGS0_9FIRM|nr:flagellar hook-length control protein FliK [Parablautia muri]NBJ93513.1 flagellar hook-length control protein FliK [Parablautia muri]